MDLEFLLRACWRRRLLILVSIFVFAAIVAGGGSLLAPQKFGGSAEIAVYPDDLTGPNVSQVYGLSPDRFVATQVAVIDSMNALSAVAKQLDVPVTTVQKMVSVNQIPKSDIIAITAKSKAPHIAWRVTQALATNYVASITTVADQRYAATQSDLNKQLQTVDSQISLVRNQVAAAGTDQSVAGPLETSLAGLLGQQQTILNELGALQSGTSSPLTHVVSSGPSTSALVGSSTKKLGIYGALLGLIVAMGYVAVTVSPGRSLENLESISEIDGIPVLGVIRTRARLREALPALRRIAGPPIRVADLRISVELERGLERYGSLTLLPIGGWRVYRSVQRIPVLRVLTAAEFKAQSRVSIAPNRNGHDLTDQLRRIHPDIDAPHELPHAQVATPAVHETHIERGRLALAGSTHSQATALNLKPEIEPTHPVPRMSVPQAADEHGAPDTDSGTGVIQVSSLNSVLTENHHCQSRWLYLGVDVRGVKPRDLVEVVETVRSSGAEILGIIGLR